MALVSKILEATLTAGSTTVTFTDSDIPNSLIRVFSSNSDVIPESRILSGNTLTVTYAPQSNNMDVALEIVKQGLDIVDNVLSEDTDKALSAKQGYLLSAAIGDVNDRIDGLVIPENITDLDDIDITSIQDGQVLSWDEDTNKFVNTTPAGSSYRESVLLEVNNFSSASGTDPVNKSYTLNESLDNFDAVIVYGYMYNVNTSTDNNRSNLMSMMIFKRDFYDVAISQGQSAANPFLLNGSLHTARRSMAFQFPDATHITTTALRTEAYVEPILYKVVGIKY